MGEAICSVASFNPGLFTPDELDIMEEVLKKLGGLSATEIRELSHMEKGWIDTPDKELILYSYADELRAFE